MVKLYFAEIEGAKSQSDSFARTILGKHLNVNGDTLDICKNEFGKPYLKDYPDIFYNISHTKGAIICALSDKPVGIDLEKVRKVNERVAKRFFTQNEQNYIFSSKENQDERFTEIWTMKEAYVKWVGKGIMMSPFGLFNVKGSIAKLFTVFKIKHYVISVCIEKTFK